MCEEGGIYSCTLLYDRNLPPPCLPLVLSNPSLLHLYTYSALTIHPLEKERSISIDTQNHYNQSIVTVYSPSSNGLAEINSSIRGYPLLC
jgi:hypothetical protein